VSLKMFVQLFVLTLFLVALLGTPAVAQAGGGYCGSIYVIQWGDTLQSIAATCGTTVAALYAANPGISGYLYAGQTLNIPSASGSYTGGYAGTYVVQYGDTFGMIASRYGITIYDLWAANPYIANVNYIYVGQVLNVPGSPSTGGTTYPKTPDHLSYGTVPTGTPRGTVKLTNAANADVYVSLQGTTNDGINVINEYTVDGRMNVDVPAGWYIYVAWVGGKKMEGQFHLPGGSTQSMTFYSSKVVVK
jgi:LysM repeat protein